jgi:hypothetical protein
MIEMSNNTIFTTEIDGKSVELLVRAPSMVDLKEAQKTYNTTFNDAVTSKALVRAKLDDFLREQGLWDTKKEAQFTSLQQELLDGEKRLAKGGFKLSEAKKVAVDMRDTRDKLRNLIAVRSSLDNNTAEGQADNQKFNYLVSACLVYNDTKAPYFQGLEDYLNKTTDPTASTAAQTLAKMLYGLDDDYDNKLPENRFLKEFNLVDSKLRLIDKDGRLIDVTGHLLDEEGRYIDDKGNFVDKDDNPVDKDGNYLFKRIPFEDDLGVIKAPEPVVVTPEPVVVTPEPVVVTPETSVEE